MGIFIGKYIETLYKIMGGYLRIIYGLGDQDDMLW